jgi:tetratricopeptide (TPR) repeat protein
LTGNGDAEHNDGYARTLDKTIDLIIQRRYEEASRFLNVAEAMRPEIADTGDEGRLTTFNAIKSQRQPIGRQFRPDLRAAALKPVVEIGHAISLIQNRQEEAALRTNTELKVFEKYYVDAMACLNVRDYIGALRNLDFSLSVAETEPDKRKAVVTKALVYLAWDNPPQAFATINEDQFRDQHQRPVSLLDLEKNLLDALSLFIISYVFYSVKRIDKAKEYLSDSKSAGIAPRFENYLMGLIYLEDKDSNQNEALSFFNIATNSDPNFSDAYNGIAVVLAQKGQLSEAD